MTYPYNKPMLQPELATHGISDDWPLGVAGRVRYAELDPVNHVNNTTYFRWFEAIRIDYMRLWGISEYEHGRDPKLVIRSTDCHFRHEMLLHEDYIVTARTRAFRNSSFTMDYAVFAPDLRATGSAVVVLLQPEGPGKFPLPQSAKDRFVTVDGAVNEG